MDSIAYSLVAFGSKNDELVAALVERFAVQPFHLLASAEDFARPTTV
jgi:hypothetical protein